MLSRELTAASAKPMVLAILSRGESYGYEIIQRVKRLSNEQIVWSEGALYPVLHRLERQGLIQSVWRKSEKGRKRKYYLITEAGVKELADAQRQWGLTNDVMSKLWGPNLCLE
ncbi:MAG: PadR family transcriptional regulator [Bacteroidota bacterium]